MSATAAIIGIGSNIEPQRHVPRSIALLKKTFTVCKQTRPLTTKAIGAVEQADYINCAVSIVSHICLDETIKMCKTIEEKMGRVRTSDKFAARVIDLDVIVWDNTVIDDDVYTRDFLYRQLTELRPDLPLHLVQPKENTQ
jgi:2-amino-4-hydroxy-6-hydroxymethyldihydropteridine diphosphokinase